MKKLYFAYLLYKHRALVFCGLKEKSDCILNIWYDDETQNTLLFADIRCGLWHMPCARASKYERNFYSYWLAYMVGTSKYLLKGSRATIFTLMEVKELIEKETNLTTPA